MKRIVRTIRGELMIMQMRMVSSNLENEFEADIGRLVVLLPRSIYSNCKSIVLLKCNVVSFILI